MQAPTNNSPFAASTLDINQIVPEETQLQGNLQERTVTLISSSDQIGATVVNNRNINGLSLKFYALLL